MAPPDSVIVPTWAVDATSGKGVPATATEWDQLVTAYKLTTPPPDHLWLMQEASGSLADSIGSVTLPPVNFPTYADSVPGWTRHGVGTPDSNTDQGFATTSLGDLDGTSYLMLLYVSVDVTPSIDRTLTGIGAGTDYRYIAITSTSVYKAAGLGGVSPTVGTVDPTTTVHPIVVEIDETHHRYLAYSDIELLPVGWANTTGTGGLLTIGSAAYGSPRASYLYAALWVGGHAELADVDVKHLLQALGWTVTGF